LIIYFEHYNETPYFINLLVLNC